MKQSLFSLCRVLLPSLLLLIGGLRTTEAQQQRPTDRVTESASKGADKAPSHDASNTVCLTVDYGDGFQKRYPQVPWHEKMTVGDLLRFAQQHRRGIELTLRGQGKMSLLVQIDDLKNQGGRGRNWVFRVNGKLSDRSLGAYQLDVGDAVLWKFDEYR